MLSTIQDIGEQGMFNRISQEVMTPETFPQCITGSMKPLRGPKNIGLLNCIFPFEKEFIPEETACQILYHSN